ncbi:hypothetical protein RIF25_10515 [Thermosynechococcaceae cyanobacterium BACA0444]|uniref:Uncharacterized protein n=1 Tax=Pseudocalidococcus azoricus BACA0444 TaxID=2918990 RepID=A0AAE4JYQ7_9CYAN|nr:hypothetical protein [Pseudocalidococcus azoricus]MDS3861239.1 hypothetical protein [Pseudocalidococcus azoricus BACA0444]
MSASYKDMEHFDFLVAACLLFNLDPIEKNQKLPEVRARVTDLRKWVEARANRINDKTIPPFMRGSKSAEQYEQDPPPENISRELLIEYAGTRGLKPSFLFPDEAEESDDELDHNRRLSYLKLILALFKQQKIGISDKDIVSKVELITTTTLEKSMDRKTINKIINEIRTHSSLKASRQK